METFFAFFPQYGKLFSTVWKTDKMSQRECANCRKCHTGGWRPGGGGGGGLAVFGKEEKGRRKKSVL